MQVFYSQEREEAGEVCNTPDAAKAQDVTKQPSLMPEHNNSAARTQNRIKTRKQQHN
jgi:hypothetical protein